MTRDLFVPSLFVGRAIAGGMEVGYLDTGCIVPLLVMLSKLKKLNCKYFHNRENTAVTHSNITGKPSL